MNRIRRNSDNVNQNENITGDAQLPGPEHAVQITNDSMSNMDYSDVYMTDRDGYMGSNASRCEPAPSTSHRPNSGRPLSATATATPKAVVWKYLGSSGPYASITATALNALPLFQAVALAREINNYDTVAHQDETAKGERWRTPLFTFVRALRGHRELVHLLEQPALEKVRRELIKCVKGPSPWQGIYDPANMDIEDVEEGDTEFRELWRTINCIPGLDLISHARMRAHQKPLTMEGVTGPQHEEFISLLGWMAALYKGGAIAVPQERIAQEIGVTQKTISRWILWAIRGKILFRIRKHLYGIPGRKNTAAVYKFDISQWACLKEAAGESYDE